MSDLVPPSGPILDLEKGWKHRVKSKDVTWLGWINARAGEVEHRIDTWVSVAGTAAQSRHFLFYYL